ncbi:hypothetical protein C5167_021245 [Papaver somniferum]|uniref:Uncharacterized protein n=1 Tax=Papaver somniferum TaxID=3469 RepID=A0A4Y7IZ98_PAPSO|nr:hypothetical protein C5167_021245 [Papaver somniferum]
MQNIIKEQRNEKKTSILGFCWRDNANIYSQKPLQISDTNKLITRADFVCEVSQAPLETRVVYRVVVQRRNHRLWVYSSMYSSQHRNSSKIISTKCTPNYLLCPKEFM